jgi:hypothetical protein
MKIVNSIMPMSDIEALAANGQKLRVAVTKTSAQGKSAQSATPNLMSFSTDENSIWFNGKKYGVYILKGFENLSTGSNTGDIQSFLGDFTYDRWADAVNTGNIVFVETNNTLIPASVYANNSKDLNIMFVTLTYTYVVSIHYSTGSGYSIDLIQQDSLVRVADINNTLTNSSTDTPLSAAMGKKLQDEKLAKTDVVNNLTTTDTSKALSAAQGKALNDKFNGNKININFSATSNSTDNATIKGYMGNIDGTTLVTKLTSGATLIDSSSEDWVITLQEVSATKVSFTGIRFAGFNLYSKNISVTISGSNYTNVTVAQGSRFVPAINNTLTSTSTSEALSAAQGKALNDRISGLGNVYRVKGTKNTIEEVYDISADARLGDVWNITSAFTIGGKPYPANTNIVCIAEWSTSTTPQNNWDPLGGTVDLSTYLSKKDASSTYATKSELSSHTGNKNNPHGVTKSQIGLGNVTNDAQVKKTDIADYNLAVKAPSASQVPSTEAFAKTANYAEMFPVSFDATEAGEKTIVSSSTTTAGGTIVWLSDMKKFAYKGTDGKYYNNWAISGSPNLALVNAGLVKQEDNSPIPGKVYIHDSGVYFSTGTDLVLAASKDSSIIIE